MSTSFSNTKKEIIRKFAELRSRRKDVVRTFKKKSEIAKIEEIKKSFK